MDAGGVDESAMIVCGLTIITQDAVSAGVVPEPGLIGVDDGNWLWHGHLYVSSGAEAAVDGAFPGLVDRLEIDSKAMRRVKASDALAFVFQTPARLTQDQTGTFDLTYDIHGLLGL